MKKHVITLLLIIAVLLLAAGCTKKSEQPAVKDSPDGKAAEPDAISTASVVDNGEDFIRAAGADGTWIIAALSDLSIDREIVLEGEFTNRGELARKIALYAQDQDRKITERYTLTAPKLIVRSPNARIQGGTFAGDVYVDAPGFLVIDATVKGDITFSSTKFRDSFKQEEGGKVTGKISVE
ncbi:MAG: hypothetical protein RBT69_03900 [Spirochaetia bacterium]|jgi:hypothetical protein|nr:hypothetical protein [Spirochaetia bacterium]